MMVTSSTRGAAVLVAATLLALTPVADGAVARGPSTRRARVGVRYVLERQHRNGSVAGFSRTGSTADAVLAFAAARRSERGLDAAIRYLRRRATRLSRVGLKAKVVLAAVAAGRDPRHFGGQNLVAEIRGARSHSGRYGNGSGGTGVTSHALAMLALKGAGRRVPQRAARWLARAQCGDGGWQFDEPPSAADDRHCFDGSDGDFARSDTNTTSYAVQALAVAPRVKLRARPFAYFRSARDGARGGWRYSHQKRAFGSRVFSDANSTALVAQAFAARHRRVPGRALKALRRLGYRRCGELAGAFAFTWARAGGRFVRVPTRAQASSEDRSDGPTVIGATIGTILGLLRRALPVPPRERMRPAPRARRCRG